MLNNGRKTRGLSNLYSNLYFFRALAIIIIPVQVGLNLDKVLIAIIGPKDTHQSPVTSQTYLLSMQSSFHIITTTISVRSPYYQTRNLLTVQCSTPHNTRHQEAPSQRPFLRTARKQKMVSRQRDHECNRTRLVG